MLLDAPPLGFGGWLHYIDLASQDGRRIAQLVEQLTLNQRVRGSSPRAPTKDFNKLGKIALSHELLRD